MIEGSGKQVEVYRYKQYRKKRVWLYILGGINVLILGAIIMVSVLSIKKIDDDIDGYESITEVVESEYGTSYVSKLRNVPTINYEKYYSDARDNYLTSIKEKESKGKLNNTALDLSMFVEYVQDDAVSTAEEYNLIKESAKFYKDNNAYIEEHGELIENLRVLIGEHQDKDNINESEIVRVIEDYDARMDLYIDYLMSLKRSK